MKHEKLHLLQTDNNKINIIFLDIDGVVYPNYTSYVHGERKRHKEFGEFVTHSS